MNKLWKVLRKIGVLLIGIPVFILGIILIPLPGPGILVCFAGLFIISLEFEWARQYRDKAQGELKKVIDKSKARQAKYEAKYGQKPRKKD